MLEKLLSAVCVSAMTAKGRMDTANMLHNAKNARSVNEHLLMRILRENRNSEYGRRYHFDEIRSVEEFKRKVPIVTYKDIEAQVERIYENNEQGVLGSRKVIGFATSSGSIGKPKHIPRTNIEVGVYTRYTVTRFLALGSAYAKAHGRRMKPTRGLCTLFQYEGNSPSGLPDTNVADIAAKKYFFIYPYILNMPLGRQFLSGDIDRDYANARFALADRELSYMFGVFAQSVSSVVEYVIEHRQMLVEDIRRGTISDAVEVRPEIRRELERRLKPDPERADELQREFDRGINETLLSRLWPNLTVISCIGTSISFEGFSKYIQSYSKGIAFDYSIYGASEGLFAAAYRCDNPGQLMLPDSCYYEFVDAENPDYGHTLAINELETGKEYEIIVTNQSGFVRYRFNDIITVLGYEGECPVINFAYRKGQLLNLSGEKTTMEHMNEAILRLERLSGEKIREWIVFADKNEVKSRYGILLETAGETDMSRYTAQFDDILCEVNRQYNHYYRECGLIDPPVIYNQKSGAHEQWRAYKIAAGASPDQVKPVRILDTPEKTEFFLSRVRQNP